MPSCGSASPGWRPRHRPPCSTPTPLGIEKGKGAELALKAKLWSKVSVKNTYAIHRFIEKALTHYDPEKGSFWKPPLKEDMSCVPNLERDLYIKQSKWLWDYLSASSANAELIREGFLMELGIEGKQFTFPEPCYDEGNAPCAAHIAVPDNEVPDEYWIRQNIDEFIIPNPNPNFDFWTPLKESVWGIKTCNGSSVI